MTGSGGASSTPRLIGSIRRLWNTGSSAFADDDGPDLISNSDPVVECDSAIPRRDASEFCQ
ncbi:MAG: hypothetical protein E7813_19440 [Bradyrhizobium sp.]|nr:MAG: hypothetical protein E7813_19440 [Bradyrhizobium sp.]